MKTSIHGIKVGQAGFDLVEADAVGVTHLGSEAALSVGTSSLLCIESQPVSRKAFSQIGDRVGKRGPLIMRGDGDLLKVSFYICGARQTESLLKVFGVAIGQPTIG